jgi:hypothetical protein
MDELARRSSHAEIGFGHSAFSRSSMSVNPRSTSR